MSGVVTAKQEIRGILLVLLSAMGTAAMAVAFLVYTYGPSGQVITRNVLLSPQALSSLSYTEPTPNGAGRRMVFDSVQFNYHDGSGRRWLKDAVAIQRYAAFYALIEDERSVAELVPALEADFAGVAESVTIVVRIEGSSRGDVEAFQTIELAGSGDAFRIQLRSDPSDRSWAYFYYPYITTKAYQTLQERA
jgi:hypothetical protein